MTANILCRVCAHEQSVEKMVNIFLSNDHGETIATSIIELTGLVVMENDGLPSVCCVQCQSDLSGSLTVRRKCLESENILKDILQINPLKQDIEDLYVEEDRKPDLSVLMECSVANETSPKRILNHKCCGCRSSFETKNELMEHSRLIHATNPPLPDPKRPFQCNVCYRWIKTQNGVEMHKRLFHIRSSIQRFENPFTAYAEISIANDDSSPIAGQFASVDGIKQEDPFEVDVTKNLECSICLVRFLHASSFDEHIEKCKRIAKIDRIVPASNINVTDDTADNEPTISSIEKDYKNDAVKSKHSTGQSNKCCGCRISFDTEHELMAHSKAVHAPDAPEPDEEEPFQCKICYSLYQTARAARIHRSLSCLRSFSCKLCDASFKSATARSKHHHRYHTDQPMKAVSKRKINRRNVEGVETSSVETQNGLAEESNKNENVSMTPGQCQQYVRTHGSNATATSNKAAEKDDENCTAESTDSTQKKLKCCGCRVQFDTENELMEHSKAVHASNAPKPNGTKPFQCTVCYYLFDTARAMNIHRSRFCQRRRCCTVCGAWLKNGLAILRHEKCLLKPDNQYPCRLCGQNFANWMARKKHEQHAHRDAIEKRYKCCGCCTQFRTENEMLEHCRLVHAPWAPPPTEGKPFQCKTCYRCFKTASNLKTHCDSKNYSFQCTTCEKQFSCYSSLVRHEKLHNNNMRPCKYCKETFSNRSELRKHVYRVHKEERANLMQHVCSVCGKTFRSADYLRLHTKLHADATPYKCFCGAQFKLKVYLTSHRKKVHNEGHTCKYCKRSFPYATLLREHENQHTGKKEMQCEICGKEFYTNTSVKRHIQKEHGKIEKRA